MNLHAPDPHPVNISRNKSSAVAFRSDLQVLSWESMCYTSPPYLPNLLLPCFQTHLLTDGTVQWHRKHTHTHLSSCPQKQHSHIHNRHANDGLPSEGSEDKHMASSTSTRTESDEQYLSFKCFIPDTLSVRLYFSHGHSEIYIKNLEMKPQQWELMCSQPALCLFFPLPFSHMHTLIQKWHLQ